MVAGALSVVGLANGLTALCFGAVAFRLAMRPVRPADRAALRAMATWWGSMSILLAVQALEAWAGAAGLLHVGAFTVARYGTAVLLAIGGWGLCYHVLYLHSGNRAWGKRLVPYFLVVFIAYLMSVIQFPIVALEPVAYEVRAVRDPPLEGSMLWQVVVLLVGLPLLAASIAYLRLVPKLERRDQKRRALFASLGILSWVGAGAAVQLTAGALADFLTYTVLGVLAAILVAIAYFPTAAMRRGDPEGAYVEVANEPAAADGEPVDADPPPAPPAQPGPPTLQPGLGETAPDSHPMRPERDDSLR